MFIARSFLPAVLIVGVIVGIGCSGDDDASATATPTVSSTAAATETGTQVETPTPTTEPTVATTGVADLDAIVEEVEAQDVAELRTRLAFQTLDCTTALGAGGPPKCAEGEADGTAVEVFEFLGCEPEWRRADAVDATLEEAVANAPGRYAAFEAPEGYALVGPGAVLVFDGPDLRVGEPPWRWGMALRVDGGRIVAMELACGAGEGAESLLPDGPVDFLLEPPPRISVEPSAGGCENELTVTGLGFEPGARVGLVLQSGRDDFAVLDQTDADASGEVRFALAPFPIGVDCERATVILRAQLLDDGTLLPAYAVYAVDE
jgi:hypothetical protein